MMIDKRETILVELRAQMRRTHCHADAVGEALPQRAGRNLDARRQDVLRVPRRLRAPLAEVRQLLLRRRLVTGQVQVGVVALGLMASFILALSRAIGETAPLITIGALTFIAFLPPPPITAQPPFISDDWLWSPFSVLPIQMFNWVSRPDQAFVVNAAAAGLVLIVVTLLLNAIAIMIRYRVRKRIKW